MSTAVLQQSVRVLLLGVFCGLAAGRPVLDQGGVSALADIRWIDAAGGEHVGVDGRGVAVYTVEGYDGSHPDLDHCVDPTRFGSAIRGVADDSGPADVIYTPRNDDDAHGSLTASMLCGDGSQSGGELRGVAPGATVFSNAISLCFDPLGGDCDLRSWFEDPRLRVITSSIGNDARPELLAWGLPEDAEVLYFQSAGNEAGDGEVATTLHEVNQGRPLAVLVAAAKHDLSDVASYSSRGARDNPLTWPSLSAPGCMFNVGAAYWPQSTAIWANNRALQLLVDNGDCPGYGPELHLERLAQGYVMHAGTSFAAPYAAGVAALMFQVNPGLTADQAYSLLTRTAQAFFGASDLNADGQISSDEFHAEHGWKAGWGLVDAGRAVAAAHYLSLNPTATVTEAVRNSRIANGQLNPTGHAATVASSRALGGGGAANPVWLWLFLGLLLRRPRTR